jgi:hypothetical protein
MSVSFWEKVAMLYSRFLIESRESALRTIRRTSGFFIWIPLIILALSCFDFFDSWLHSQARAETLASSLETVAGLIAYMLGKFVRNDWFSILVLVNAIFLRRYRTRVAAILFVLVSLYGAGLGLYMIWTMLREHVSQHLFLMAISVTVISVLCLLIGARALVAAVKLQREFAEDPATPASTVVGSP